MNIISREYRTKITTIMAKTQGLITLFLFYSASHLMDLIATYLYIVLGFFLTR